MEPEAVVAALATDAENGLSSAEAAGRLLHNGPNELRATPQPSTWRRILSQFQDPLIYLLLAAVAIALAAWAVEGQVGWPVDASVIAAIVLLNAVLGHVQEAKAQNAVAALAKMTAATSAVLRDGKPQRVPSGELVRGDVLVLAEGDAVGADARLLQSTTLLVHEAALTGESEAVLKDSAALPKPAALGDQLNMVFKGTAVAQGAGRAVVTDTGMYTQVGQVAALLDATVATPTPLEKEVARVGRSLGIAILVIAFVVVGTILLASNIRTAADIVPVLLLGVSLAVAAVPEGLPAEHRHFKELFPTDCLGMRGQSGSHSSNCGP
jgi:P-type Ca2+ transporter type 2C